VTKGGVRRSTRREIEAQGHRMRLRKEAADKNDCAAGRRKTPGRRRACFGSTGRRGKAVLSHAVAGGEEPYRRRTVGEARKRQKDTSHGGQAGGVNEVPGWWGGPSRPKKKKTHARWPGPKEADQKGTSCCVKKHLANWDKQKVPGGEESTESKRKRPCQPNKKPAGEENLRKIKPNTVNLQDTPGNK